MNKTTILLIIGIMMGTLMSDIVTGYICNTEGYLISLQYGKIECSIPRVVNVNE